MDPTKSLRGRGEQSVRFELMEFVVNNPEFPTLPNVGSRATRDDFITSAMSEGYIAREDGVYRLTDDGKRHIADVVSSLIQAHPLDDDDAAELLESCTELSNVPIEPGGIEYSPSVALTLIDSLC